MAKKKQEPEVEGTEQTQDEKSHNLLVASLEKVLGKGAVATLDNKRFDLNFIETDYLGFNMISGGGFARRRITELFSGAGAGKCLGKDAYIATQDGLLTVEEIFKLNGMEASCIIKEAAKSYGLQNMNGNIENTTYFTFNGRRKVCKVRTERGTEIVATRKHPLLVMDNDGSLCWKYVKDLSNEDWLVKPNKLNFGNQVNEDAYILGVMVADAHYNRVKIMITNNDPCILAAIDDFCEKYNVHVKKYYYKNNNSTNVSMSDKKFVEIFYKKHGIIAGNAKDKVVPITIRMGNENTARDFLAGFFDCECSVDDRKQALEVTSASKELLVQIRLMLNQFGIQSSINVKNVKTYPDNEYYRIHISGTEAEKFFNIIGTRSKARSVEYNNCMSYDTQYSTFDTIPNLNFFIKWLYKSEVRLDSHIFSKYIYSGKAGERNVSRNALRKILEHTPKTIFNKYAYNYLESILNAEYVFEKIESVQKDFDEIPTFDFTMEHSESFIANGVISHNSSMVLHGLYKVQQAGKRGLFIDAERSLSRRFVEMMRVNPSWLEVVTPSCGEQGFQVLHAALLSGIYDMIAVDSVHAMMPKAMMNAEPGEAKMMELARLFSNELPKVRDAFSHVETSVVFVNQMRYKPNPMGHGPGKTTPGGDALPFYADLRVQMTKTEKIKSGSDAIIGHVVDNKGVKTRFTSPDQVCSLDYIYGYGFCEYRELINFGVEYNVIAQNGSWLSYNEEKIGQGRSQAVELLKSNRELFDRIKGEVIEAIKE